MFIRIAFTRARRKKKRAPVTPPETRRRRCCGCLESAAAALPAADRQRKTRFCRWSVQLAQARARRRLAIALSCLRLRQVACANPTHVVCCVYICVFTYAWCRWLFGKNKCICIYCIIIVCSSRIALLVHKHAHTNTPAHTVLM